MFHGRVLPPYLQSLAQRHLPTASRRQFLIGASYVGAALLVGCSSDSAPESSAATPAAAPAAMPGKPTPFDAYVGIGADGTVTVYSSQFEMGQYVHQGLATLVAEELGVPIERVQVETRAGNPQWYGNLAMGGALQLTGGSSSIPSSWQRYREAGAVAREMLRQAAAQRWSVPVAEVEARDGVVMHAGSHQRAEYAELLEAASRLPLPADVTLKSADAWTLIGQDTTQRVDAQGKVTGKQTYTIDVRLPGMLHATVLHSPRFGGKVASIDAAKAKAVPGVVDVVQISRGVAVVARNTWAAIQGMRALEVSWDDSAAESRSSEDLFNEFEQTAQQPGMVALQRGDNAAGMAGASKTIEAAFRFPFLVHAAMEPLNAVAHRDGERLHLYGGLQMPDVVQGTCAQIAGVDPSKVDLHVMKTGGGFGRRATPDSDVFVEAVEIAKAIDFRAPVHLQWTREADMGGGRYRPMHVHRVKVGLSDDGKIVGWEHRVVGVSIFAGGPFASMMKDGIDPSSTEGIVDSPYAIPNMEVQVHHPTTPVPVLWWRSVGHTHTAFVMETLLDEIAEMTGQDPVALRLSLLPADARERGVLQLAADKAGWSEPAKPGVHRGIAVHSSFGSFVATAAEVSKRADGAIKVERCVVATDCGVVVNPDVVRAQVEGGSGFGLGAFLGEQLELDGGAAKQRNFDGYRPLRIDAMPRMEVHMLTSAASPTGIGECAVPPVAPAVANAIYQATGKRVRQLPLRTA
ncbi:MAG: xanthine dehydrogenase family protein molybdopterin-binding subunit [Xanthomonadales bacterium]|nr:xanthine dehydrogenase family protein molybdopterin-binding subunit [Xanthomonadales bacterium]